MLQSSLSWNSWLIIIWINVLCVTSAGTLAFLSVVFHYFLYSPSFVVYCANSRVTVHCLFKWRLAWTSCIPAFILGSKVQQQECMEAQGGKRILPQWFIWTFPLFEMASQRPCMINVTTFIYTVLPKFPAEFLKPRNFSECPWAGLGILYFDWQSACYSTFPIVHVMSGTRVNTATYWVTNG